MNPSQITQTLSNNSFESETILKIVQILADKLVLITIVVFLSLTILGLAFIFKVKLEAIVDDIKTIFIKKKR